MSGLYSPINRAAESIHRPKGTGAEYMAELQKKPGYKPAEAEDRDLQALMALPQMERAAFMEKLQAQKNKFPLKMRELEGTQTHHDDYTMPGGENYREILLHTPMPEGQGFEGRSHHFGGMPNILASIRVKDRMTPEGKKMLHLEEIQSDWHQQGREAGYQPKDLDNQLKEVAQWKKRLEKTQFLGMDKYEYAEHMKALEDAEEEQNKLEQLKEEGVPYGPHAKDWHELALKAMIQHAAENGYDQLGITPGAEQAKRFSLSKQVGSVSYNPETKHFQAFKPNRETITNEKGATPERIQELIGKEAAAKLLQAPQTMGHHYLEGENLDIGGEGMKGFYDRMVPSFLNKFGKKHGVQVQQGAIGTGEHRVVNDGHADLPHRVSNSEGFVSRHATPEEAQARAAQLNQAPVHTFDITPAMREDILKNGIPRYDEGGIIHKAEGGSMQEPSIHQMRNALMGRPNVTSLSNLTSIGAQEAPSMPVKTFIPPHGAATNGSIPVGGVDENVMQPGQQLMPQQPQQPQQPGQPQAGAQPQQGQPQPPQGPQSNILSMTPQGQAMAAMRPAGMADGGVARFDDGGQPKKVKYIPPGMGRGENEPPLPRVAPMSKAEIERIALRMAPQIAGQYTPVAEKPQKQFASEQTMRHDIQPTASALNPTQDVDLAHHIKKVMVGLPGDYTTTNQEVRGVAGKKLKYPVVQQGGSRYGETHPNAIWASNKEAAENMMNLADAASRQYGDAEVLANHIKMGPESAYYAKHYVRAMLSAIESARLNRAQKEELTKMLREKEFGYGQFPDAPHVKNMEDLYAHIDTDPNFRRHVGAMMNRKYATEPYGIISGADMLHATSEPELRNLETGVTGHSIGELHFNKPLTSSSHSTYSHDIPGSFLGKLPVPVPYELSFPDAVNALRNSKDPAHKKSLFGSLKMFGARQPIDQQLVDEIGQYRDRIKQLTGKKKGGGVKLHTDQDTMALELSRKKKVK